MVNDELDRRISMDFPSTIISLIVFDGDDTLWFGLDGAYISGVEYWDDGRQDFTFQQLDPLTIQRNDGPRFQLFPEVPGLLKELTHRNILVSIASYNHRAPVMDSAARLRDRAIFQIPCCRMAQPKRQDAESHSA